MILQFSKDGNSWEPWPSMHHSSAITYSRELVGNKWEYAEWDHKIHKWVVIKSEFKLILLFGENYETYET